MLSCTFSVLSNLLGESCDTISPSDMSVEATDTEEVRIMCNNVTCLSILPRVCHFSEMVPSGRE